MAVDRPATWPHPRRVKCPGRSYLARRSCPAGSVPSFPEAHRRHQARASFWATASIKRAGGTVGIGGRAASTSPPYYFDCRAGEILAERPYRGEAVDWRGISNVH